MPHRFDLRFQALLSAVALAVGMAAPSAALYIVRQFGKAAVPEETATSHGWPNGALEVINHPLRVQGWEPFFSECPNDVEHFGYRIESAHDANRLLRTLGRIQGEKPFLILSVEPGFRWDRQEVETYQATFVLGSRKILDEWWARLPGGKFGVSVYKEPPKAMAPRMTLYLGDGKIDPRRLRVPPGIRTGALIPEELRLREELRPLIRRVENLVAERGNQGDR